MHAGAAGSRRLPPHVHVHAVAPILFRRGKSAWMGLSTARMEHLMKQRGTAQQRLAQPWCGQCCSEQQQHQQHASNTPSSVLLEVPNTTIRGPITALLWLPRPTEILLLSAPAVVRESDHRCCCCCFHPRIADSAAVRMPRASPRLLWTTTG